MQEIGGRSDGEVEPGAAVPSEDAGALALQAMASLETARRALELQEARLRQEAAVVEALGAVGSALTAELDLERLVQKVTDAAVSVSGAAFGAFFYNLVDDRGESYSLYTLSGAPRAAFEGFPMPRNTAIFDPTFRGEAVIRSADITQDPRYGQSAPYHGMPPGHLPVHSYLAVPVVSRSGEVLGGLFLGHPERGIFAERHERLVVGVAAQAAVAMDNARLYRQQREAAVELQRSLLPELPEIPGLDVATRYLPGAQGADVGGDWFDVIRLSGGRVAFVVGDVMGRGLGAAAVMGQLRSALRAYAVLDLPPQELLGHLNTLVADMPGSHIATCLYAVYDPACEQLSFSSAGHVPPLLLGRDGARFIGQEPGTPLGVPFRVPHTEAVRMPAGTTLVLVTDGLVENRGESLDRGLERLRHAATEVSAQASLDELADWLLSTCLYEDGARDDVALLAARASTAAAPRHQEVVLDGVDDAVREARRFTAAALATWGVADGDEALLVVAELVGNAVRHSAGAPRLRLLLGGDRLTVEVGDDSTDPPRFDDVAATDESGRGLLIVDRVATRWGSRLADQGKVVWAELELREPVGSAP